MNEQDVPPEWAQIMEQRGFTYGGRPSVRRLSEKSGISSPTLAALMRKKRSPQPDTIMAVAEALQISPKDVGKLIGIAVPDVAGPYEPPAEAQLLTESEREVVSSLIRMIVKPRPGQVSATIGEKKPKPVRAEESNVKPFTPRVSDNHAINSEPAQDDYRQAARSQQSMAGEQQHEHKGDPPRHR